MRPLLLFAISAPAFASQWWYPKHNLTFGVGAGQPQADLVRFFNDSAGLSVNYGYRFHPNLQAEVGFDTIFFAARVRDYISSGSFGDLRIHDYQFLIPVGVRAILPLERGRFLISAGGGGVHMRYTELLRQPGEYFRIDCRVCGSRSGWGYYGLIGGSAFVDRRKHFRIGVTSRVYQGHTDGDPIGPLPGLRTRDRWVNVFGELGLSF